MLAHHFFPEKSFEQQKNPSEINKTSQIIRESGLLDLIFSYCCLLDQPPIFLDSSRVFLTMEIGLISG